ncbi:sigma-70 family RNA polymerase sigma factor [Micromonospora sp. WMMA1363]|uniref:RNA polymerase sigma factor n=1 Tax=Micromonospora sp. WMMA1363 TaxID=3053985 RepID=UPI00259C7919|nr:sigma-70 family RNA polymerase sigma factor [Micromonospora sp. WMMA1363]MDM4719446.1 sigma-70 family RNA polymerase sigma factor [Micromonospora sp. WMMA1363]
MSHDDVAGQVRAAAGGDQAAWDALVRRYARLVWAVARGFRLGEADAADVSQATWLRLVENLGQLRNPASVGAWLATTARREALALLRSRREVPMPESATPEPVDDTQPAPWQRLVAEETDAELWHAFRGLPARCQELLRLLVLEPTQSYAVAAAALSVPIGSLGPTRARCLAALRASLGEPGPRQRTKEERADV